MGAAGSKQGAVFRQIFEKLDKKNRGYLDQADLVPLIKAITDSKQLTDIKEQVEALASADEGHDGRWDASELRRWWDDRGFNDTTADYVLMALSEASQLRAWDVGFTRTARSKQGATICDMVMKDWEVDLGATRGRSATTPSQGTGAPSLFSDAYIHKLFENKRRALKAQKEAIQLKEHEFKRNLFHQKRMVKKRETQRRRTIARRDAEEFIQRASERVQRRASLRLEGRHVPSVGSGDAKVTTSEHRLPAPKLPALRRSKSARRDGRGERGRRRQRASYVGRMDLVVQFRSRVEKAFQDLREDIESRFSSAESSEQHTSGETGVYETKVQESETPLVSRPESTRQSAATPPCSAVGSQSDLAAAAEKVAEEDLKTGDGSVASKSPISYSEPSNISHLRKTGRRYTEEAKKIAARVFVMEYLMMTQEKNKYKRQVTRGLMSLSQYRAKANKVGSDFQDRYAEALDDIKRELILTGTYQPKPDAKLQALLASGSRESSDDSDISPLESPRNSGAGGSETAAHAVRPSRRRPRTRPHARTTSWLPMFSQGRASEAYTAAVRVSASCDDQGAIIDSRVVREEQ